MEGPLIEDLGYNFIVKNRSVGNRKIFRLLGKDEIKRAWPFTRYRSGFEIMSVAPKLVWTMRTPALFTDNKVFIQLTGLIHYHLELRDFFSQSPISFLRQHISTWL